MPLQVKAAYFILALLAGFIVTMLGIAAWQEPEIRVLLLVFGVSLVTLWAGITIIDYMRWGS